MTRDAYRDPIYNLKAVVERTDVTADALRAWERRYGLPDPARTEAGHRIYAERDIDVINWLVARQQEGLRISRAVKLWRSLVEDGQDPLRNMPVSSQEPVARRPRGETMAELLDTWREACMAFDEQRAEQVLTEALAMYPPDRVFSGVVGAGFEEIGRSWYVGETSPQQEHFATELASRRLKALIAATPPPTRRGRVMLAAPPGEDHTLGIDTFSLLLRREGWDVVDLGGNVPLQAMGKTIAAVEPDLIVLAAQRLEAAASLLRAASVVREKAIPLGYGGRIFNQEPSLRDRIPGHFLGATLDAGVQEVDRLMTAGRTTPQPAPLPRKYETAGAHFVEQLPAIEFALTNTFELDQVDQGTFRDLRQDMASAIQAALDLGDLGLLSHHLEWLRGQRDGGSAAAGILDDFVLAYHEAVQSHLDERGAPVVGWFDEQVDEISEDRQAEASG